MSTNGQWSGNLLKEVSEDRQVIEGLERKLVIHESQKTLGKKTLESGAQHTPTPLGTAPPPPTNGQQVLDRRLAVNNARRRRSYWNQRALHHRVHLTHVKHGVDSQHPREFQSYGNRNDHHRDGERTHKFGSQLPAVGPNRKPENMTEHQFCLFFCGRKLF